ncbi:hypothetical protein [Lactococcus protaetiae]|uniref:DUF669 domain-containing protein n=1 Tax=Lactococcus protaetiae TaxID=2592653 RepID=A0A514Z6X2_9LACT|nr:hypothetical protein [Lactococcus protaetiae]QDK70326.1 hypothetical protein FLP15_03020 [Lactococcus protaetiae]
MNDNEILGWDDEVEEGSPFVLLPEGDYPFIITGLDRGIYEKPANRESKVPANCPMATVTLEFTAPTGEKTTLTEKFYLYKKMQWKINQFFTSIGAQKNAEGKVRMNWNGVLGAHGTASLIINKYMKDNKEKENNKIDTFLEPTQQTSASGYQAPQQNYQQPPVQNQAPQQNVTPFPQQTSAPQNGAGYNF